MSDVVSLEEHFAIVADSDRAGAPRRVLKHGDTFGVFDLLGNVLAVENGEHGLYHAGTRFLSRFEAAARPEAAAAPELHDQRGQHDPRRGSHQPRRRP